MSMNIILFILTLGFTTQTFSKVESPLEHFEITVIESLPENINLDMSLRELTHLKHNSKIGETKKEIYAFLKVYLGPVLNAYATKENENLFELATKLPADKLLENLLAKEALEKKLTGKNTPVDFLLLIFPKVPASEKNDGLLSPYASLYLPYAHLYSKNKAPVIDTPLSEFKPGEAYIDTINKKLSDSIFYSYRRNYVELGRKNAFFVGALLNIHLEGDQSWVKTQLLGGLPTDQMFDFVQDAKPQAEIKSFHLPNTPTYETLLEEDFPGVIMDLHFTPKETKPLFLNVTFGSLGLVGDRSWKTIDELSPYDPDSLTAKFGVNLHYKTYNTPYLFGTLFEPLEGQDKVNNILKYEYDLNINVHEATIDLINLEITDIKTSLQFVRKNLSRVEDFVDGQFVRSLVKDQVETVTIQMPSVNDEFLTKGNEALAPVKEKAQFILNHTPAQLLEDPTFRAELFEMIFKTVESKVDGGVE